MPGRSQPAAVAIEVSRLNALLRAAEDEIIRLRCEREDGREGVWGRRGDRAGLKERVEGGGKGYGPLVFIKASSVCMSTYRHVVCLPACVADFGIVPCPNSSPLSFRLR
jgi:hypothetical protein